MGLQTAGDVQGAHSLVGGDRVPDAARYIQHVPRVQNQISDRFGGCLAGVLDVAVQRKRAGGAVDPPAFGAVQLDHDGVVVVPMDAEPLGAGPRRVQVGLHAGAQFALNRFGESGEGRVEFVDAVQGEGGALGERLLPGMDGDGDGDRLSEHRTAADE